MLKYLLNLAFELNLLLIMIKIKHFRIKEPVSSFIRLSLDSPHAPDTPAAAAEWNQNKSFFFTNFWNSKNAQLE